MLLSSIKPPCNQSPGLCRRIRGRCSVTVTRSVLPGRMSFVHFSATHVGSASDKKSCPLWSLRPSQGHIKTARLRARMISARPTERKPSNWRVMTPDRPMIRVENILGRFE
jgi:hypothetical protein